MSVESCRGQVNCGSDARGTGPLHPSAPWETPSRGARGGSAAWREARVVGKGPPARLRCQGRGVPALGELGVGRDRGGERWRHTRSVREKQALWAFPLDVHRAALRLASRPLRGCKAGGCPRVLRHAGPFHCRVIFHHAERLHLTRPGLVGWAFGLFPLFGDCDSCCCEHHCKRL